MWKMFPLEKWGVNPESSELQSSLLQPWATVWQWEVVSWYFLTFKNSLKTSEQFRNTTVKQHFTRVSEISCITVTFNKYISRGMRLQYSLYCNPHFLIWLLCSCLFPYNAQEALCVSARGTPGQQCCFRGANISGSCSCLWWLPDHSNLLSVLKSLLVFEKQVYRQVLKGFRWSRQ